MAPLSFKKGHGKLGPLAPLIGHWTVTTGSPRGPVSCHRRFERVLDGHYVQLQAQWTFSDSGYEEIALFGVTDGKLRFWSFTSDGKRSEGEVADGSDVHPQALCFEARMPAGRARFLYWPHPQKGFLFAVESQTQKGWNRFLEHHYLPG